MSGFILKQKTIKFIYAFLFYTLFLCTTAPSAHANAPYVPQSYDILNTPTAAAAAYAGAGAAAPSDFSAMDVNPALLPALERKYTLFGTASGHSDLDLFEVGVVDNATAPVAAALRLRQTVVPGAESKDRQVEGALGYRLPGTYLSIGAGGAYEQYDLGEEFSRDETNVRVNIGMFYQWNAFDWGRPVFIGFAIRDLVDEYSPITFDLGASTTFGEGFYTLLLDATFDDEAGFRNVIAGVQIAANTYLDFRGSLGFSNDHAGGDHPLIFGFGVFVKTPVLQVFGTVSQTDLRDDIAYNVGIALQFNDQ
jgi:hypothetical protein